jgi:glycosyltransferase involved in cell wall biosynthesis
MKVIQVMAGEGDGGLENHFTQLCNGLSSRGLQVTAISEEKYRSRFESAVNFVPLNLNSPRLDPVILFNLICKIRKIKPDIVHSHANKATAMIATVKPILNSKTIATVHSQKKNVSMFEKMDAVIGVSNGVLERIKNHRKRIIHNGMPAYIGHTISRAKIASELSLNPEKPISIAVGRLVPVKAFDNLIKAWRADFGQLVIFGEGLLESHLKALVVEQGMQSFIILAGNYHPLRGLLNAVDLMIFSSHREGYSYAMAEALIAGLPVISTEVAGAMETLPKQNLVPVNDILALSNKIKESIDDIECLKQRMMPVHQWAMKNLTVDKMLDKTINSYELLLKNQFTRINVKN